MASKIPCSVEFCGTALAPRPLSLGLWSIDDFLFPPSPPWDPLHLILSFCLPACSTSHVHVSSCINPKQRQGEHFADLGDLTVEVLLLIVHLPKSFTPPSSYFMCASLEQHGFELHVCFFFLQYTGNFFRRFVTIWKKKNHFL